MKVFHGMTLITCTGVDDVCENAVVVVEDGCIAAVGTTEEISPPPGAERIDLEGRTMLPGLIDAHIHSCLDASGDPMAVLMGESAAMTAVKAVRHLRDTLLGGVTYVRDLGGRGHIDLALRDAIAAGIIPGPGMCVAARLITMTGGHGHVMGREADGVDDCRRAAREQIKAGADVVKFMATGGVMTPGVDPGASQLTRDEMAALVMEAHRAGRRSATHAQGTEGIRDAVAAGVDSVEHGIYLDEETVDLMKKRGTYFVPTLAASHWIVEHGVKGGVPEFAVRKAEAAKEHHLRSFQMAREAGVKIAMGTDAGTPFNCHGANHHELRLMVEQGMTPLRALHSATRVGAQLLGVSEQVGTVQVGKRADLIVVDGDPLEDIEVLARVHGVYRGGARVCG